MRVRLNVKSARAAIVCGGIALAMLGWATVTAPPARAAAAARVVISELLLDPAGPDAGNQYVELTNLGPNTINMANWSICSQIQYRQFPASARIAPYGTYLIYLNRSGAPPDTSTWYTGPYVTEPLAGGSFGLYHSVGGYTTPANVEDFVQWGSVGQHLENVAIAAGIWSSGTALTVPAEGLALAYTGTKTLPHPAGDYVIEAPSPQALNPALAAPPLLINEVLAESAVAGSGQTTFEIANPGPGSVALGGLHWRYGTPGGADLTGAFPAGRLLEPGGYVVVHLNADCAEDSVNVCAGPGPDLDPAGGSLALYKNALNDADSLNLIDYVAWGAGGQPLEAVAVAAEQWTGGEFVPRVPAGHSIGYVGPGSNAAGWCDQAVPTPGAATNCGLIGVPEGPGGRWPGFLRGAPNPFRGATRLTTGTLPAGSFITVTIFDVNGRVVRRLKAGAAPESGLDETWDGRDDAGRLMPAGAYWAELRGNGSGTPTFRHVQRLTLVR